MTAICTAIVLVVVAADPGTSTGWRLAFAALAFIITIGGLCAYVADRVRR